MKFLLCFKDVAERHNFVGLSIRQGIYILVIANVLFSIFGIFFSFYFLQMYISLLEILLIYLLFIIKIVMQSLLVIYGAVKINFKVSSIIYKIISLFYYIENISLVLIGYFHINQMVFASKMKVVYLITFTYICCILIFFNSASNYYYYCLVAILQNKNYDSLNDTFYITKLNYLKSSYSSETGVQKLEEINSAEAVVKEDNSSTTRRVMVNGSSIELKEDNGLNVYEKI